MHYTVAVLIEGSTQPADIENAVEAALAPYDVDLEVAPYDVVIDAESLDRAAKHYEIDRSDLDGLAMRLRDWDGMTGRVENGQVIGTSTYNPRGKYDWWEIGGRWDGEKMPGNRCLVNQLSPEIMFHAVCSPDGWHERPGWGDGPDDQWLAEQTEVLSGYPNHLCVLVDAHV